MVSIVILRGMVVSCSAHAHHFDKLVVEAHRLGVEENVPTIVVPQQDQHQELGTDAYFGGVVFTQHASVHPAKLRWHFANGA